jgi:two-component system nitrogen regulation response regulator GlnG
MNNKNILIVDDEPEILSIFRIFLETEGYHVESASTAKEAFAWIKAKKFNLAVIDINLPDTSGTDLLKKIQAIQPEVIKIVVTGENISEELQEFLNSNVIGAYIVKPVKKKMLMKVIKEKIGVCELHQENKHPNAG